MKGGKMFYLLPEPKKIEEMEGIFRLDPSYIYWRKEDDRIILNAVQKLKDILPAGWKYTRVSKDAKIKNGIEIKWGLDETIKNEEGYLLNISRERISIDAKTVKGAFYGIQTLIQVIKQVGRTVPCLKITDFPTYKIRSFYLDLTRGRVPKTEELFKLVDILSHYKINQFQVYLEHTFSYRNHPMIGYDADPLTPEDILKLDSYCSLNCIDLVPSPSSLGHLSNVLKHPDYKEMAEDLGEGIYEDKDFKGIGRKGWTISPAHPKTYKFIEGLYDELLPLFSSKLVNVCCDEPWDLGKGQTLKLCQNKKVDEVYLEHILKLKEIASRYGKRIMFWADVVLHYHQWAFKGEFDKGLLYKIPKDVIPLNWGYSRECERAVFNKHLKEANLNYYVCPSTNSYLSLFPLTEVAFDNILNFSKSGLEYGAEGVLNTEWGDGGHYNFIENSLYGILTGADISWNTEYEGKGLPKRFSVCFFGDKGEMGKATTLLGKSAEMIKDEKSGWLKARFLNQVFFAPADNKEIYNRAYVEKAKKVIENCEEALNIIEEVMRKRPDRYGVLPYYQFAAELQIHSAKKLIELSKEKPDRESLLGLRNEMTGLRKKFEELWFLKNRKSEINIALGRYDNVIESYNKILF